MCAVIITPVIKLISREHIMPLPYQLHIIVKVAYWYCYIPSQAKITISYFLHLNYVLLSMPHIYICLQLLSPVDIERLCHPLIQVKITKSSIQSITYYPLSTLRISAVTPSVKSRSLHCIIILSATISAPPLLVPQLQYCILAC